MQFGYNFVYVRDVNTSIDFFERAFGLERAVAAGATLLNPPKTKPWGQTVASVRCPDGTLVELCTPMG